MFFFPLRCNCQQAVEDLLEDEDEDYDKDDKVIMSYVCPQTHTPNVRTRLHTLPQEGLTLLHKPETQTDERNDSVSPSRLLPPSVIVTAWGTNTCTKIVQPFNLLKSFLCRYTHDTFLIFLPCGLLCFGLLLQFGALSSFSPSDYTLSHLFFTKNVLLQSRFLRTCTHIKCLVSYLGPFTAPLCSSKTASGLVQTLSGNNRWLLYCLRSFTLEKQLLKQMPLDRIQCPVNVPPGNGNWNGPARYIYPMCCLLLLFVFFGETHFKLKTFSVWYSSPDKIRIALLSEVQMICCRELPWLNNWKCEITWADNWCLTATLQQYKG